MPPGTPTRTPGPPEVDRSEALDLLHRTATQVVADVVGPGLRDGDPVAAGRTAWDRLTPAILLAAAAGLPPRGASAVAYHALESACLRLLRHGAVDGGEDSVQRLLAGTGFVVRRPSRPLKVPVDAGPPVELPVPGVCCALLRTPTPQACPTCPQHDSDGTRVRLTREWVSSLDDHDFHHVCGRGRWC